MLSVADYQSGLDAYNAGFYANALKDWKQVAESPPSNTNPAIYAETLYAIAMLYWLGQGVTKDYFNSSNWLHKAADLGHAGAQAKIGYLYTEGIAVRQDYSQAFQWFTRAARQGDKDGQYNLGIFYLNGWGTEQDTTLGKQYLAAATAQGDQAAEEALHSITTTSPVIGRSSADFLQPIQKDQPQATTYSKEWILRQDPDHYTIQVVGLRSRSRLETLTEGHKQLAPFASYAVQLDSKPIYILIQGIYTNVDAARKARDNFPRAIQKTDQLWIRQFGKIQELILAEVGDKDG
jgi:TPR repeat protein